MTCCIAISIPLLMEVIFGGPNQLGSTAGYSLGPGYYVGVLSKGTAAVGLVWHIVLMKARGALS